VPEFGHGQGDELAGSGCRAPFSAVARVADRLDMFALSDLVTRPVGHPITEQAAEQIRWLVVAGIPGAA
jgi:hypothetical protein